MMRLPFRLGVKTQEAAIINLRIAFSWLARQSLRAHGNITGLTSQRVRQNCRWSRPGVAMAQPTSERARNLLLRAMTTSPTLPALKQSSLIIPYQVDGGSEWPDSSLMGRQPQD